MFELWLGALALLAIGLFGTVLPGVPGMPLVIGGILLFAAGTGLAVIGPFQLFIAVSLGLLGMGLNFVGHIIGARKFGASRLGMVGAIVGVIPGILLLGPFGLVLGPLIGAVAFELMQGREMAVAFRSGAGVLVGYLFGALAESLIALALTAWFIWSTFGPATSGSPGPFPTV